MEKSEIKEILSHDKNLKYCKGIKDSDCLRASYPIKNKWSFNIAAQNTYPQFEKYFREKNMYIPEDLIYIERFDGDHTGY